MGLLTGNYLPLIFFVLTVALGVWLTKRGKPYPGLLFNVHKLTALAGVVLIVFRTIKISNTMSAFSQLLPLFVIGAIGVLLLFASGAFLSADKLKYSLVLLLHRIGLAMLFLCLALAVIVFK
jgi:hypothetical protein